MARKRTSTTRRRSPKPDTARSADDPALPELVVMTRPQARFRASAGRFLSATGEDVSHLEKMLTEHSATMAPVFGPTEERVQARTATLRDIAQSDLDDLSLFYRVEAPAEQLQELREQLESDELVEAAFLKPAVELPRINDMLPVSEEPPAASPDYTARQIYLEPAPSGIDARWSWTQAGGRGRDIRIIDIEGAWRFTHEDLTQNQGGVVAGTQINGLNWRNHGTAVLGVYSGDLNTIGVMGIASDAIATAVSHGGIGSAAAINQAAARLRAGDIMILEMHRPGPRHNFATRDDQLGYIAVEWWPDDYAAILNATSRGIIVVEAAGNGAEDLDDILYQTPGPGFPSTWRNPFRRANRDSGAIIVGAGAPPPGTHGRNHGADRSRLGFSNWGALIDAQGWGREVTTTGYGDLQGGTNEDLWYTDTFSGTSSASPIVAGAIACVQGIAKARNRNVLTPAQVRNCFRSTGSAQQDTPGRPATQRVGNRPDIRAFVACALGKGKELNKEVGKEVEIDVKTVLRDKAFSKELKEKELKEFKESKEFKEKEKEFKELKEKDKDKDLIEGKLFEKGIEGRLPAAAQPDESMAQRISALEQTVVQLVHFIGQELRPNVGVPGLQGGGAQAKQDKDLKDTEKLSEG